MFVYDKKLQYPVKIAAVNPRLAAIIISQYGGPDGELGASLRYLSQRYAMPFDELKGLLTDIGTEELGHLEMIGAIVHQLTRNLKDSQMKDSAFAPYFVDHTAGVYPTAASGSPWNAASMAVKGDPMADLVEDMAAEQKARVTYDNILRLSDDPDVNDVIKFLRDREVATTNATVAALAIIGQLEGYKPIDDLFYLRDTQDETGGFKAGRGAPVPDLLSTATTLFLMGCYDIRPVRPVHDFIEAHWLDSGGFSATLLEDSSDVEYVFYGLLALGAL